MQNLLLSAAVAAVAIALPSTAMAFDSSAATQIDSKASPVVKEQQRAKSRASSRGGSYGARNHFRGRNWGPRNNGFWFAGFNAPGGWGGYARPSVGYIIPQYWLNPTYRITNYPSYGLTQPRSGAYWTRYYNDAVLTDNRGYVYDARPEMAWENYGDVYQNSAYPSVNVDDGVYGNGGPVYQQTGVYDGTWTGAYKDSENRVYEGQWNGVYTDENGQAYQGTWTGTTVGAPVYEEYGAPYAGQQQAYAQPAPQPSYSQSVEGYERCRSDNGLGGAVIGAVVGGVAGNRIAGRGDRLAGTLIGAGVGGAVGMAIDKADDGKCREYMPQGYGQQYYQPAPQPQYAPQQRQPSGYGWQGGYVQQAPQGYYYPQQQYYQVGYVQQAAPQTTVIVQPGSSSYTETTTVVEEYYEPAPRRYVAPKKSKAKVKVRQVKPRCGC